MQVDIRKAEDVVVVELEGDLVAGTGDEVLREVMNELLGSGYKKILIDLSQVHRIDSAGIGELVASMKLAERVGTSVRLLHVTGRVKDVLEFSRVLPLFHVYDDEQEALSRFASAEE